MRLQIGTKVMLVYHFSFHYGPWDEQHASLEEHIEMKDVFGEKLHIG